MDLLQISLAGLNIMALLLFFKSLLDEKNKPALPSNQHPSQITTAPIPKYSKLSEILRNQAIMETRLADLTEELKKQNSKKQQVQETDDLLIEDEEEQTKPQPKKIQKTFTEDDMRIIRQLGEIKKDRTTVEERRRKLAKIAEEGRAETPKTTKEPEERQFIG